MKFCALVILLVCGAAYGGKQYHGYQVIRAFPKTLDETRILQELENAHPENEIWGENTNFVDIMISPEFLSEALHVLDVNNVVYKTSIADVGRLVEMETARLKSKSEIQNQMTWTDYNRLETIYDWLHNLTLLYPHLVSMETIGLSTEQRELRVLKVSTGGATGKPALWMDGTIHAREWISPAAVTYFINELVTKSNNYWDILQAVDFYFLPVVNPDGYEFTFDSDRLWRKTRSDHDSPFGCMGVDANRNFEVGFGGVGSSNDKCSNTYRGPEAYSEPEAAALQQYITSRPEVNWQAFITVHSYGQLWLLPYGYTDDKPENYVEQKELGDTAAAVLASMYGTLYEVGSSSDVLYKSSGSSRDWSYGAGGFRWSITLELRDEGDHGFVLPPEQILPTCEETWEAVLVVARRIMEDN